MIEPEPNNDNNIEDKKKYVEKIGDKLYNSRIYINYKTNPPEIKFDYPDTNIRQISRSTPVLLISLLISFIMCAFLIACWTSYIDRYVFPNSYDAQINFVKINNYPALDNYTNLYVEYTWMNKTENTTVRFQREGLFWYYPSLMDIKTTNRALMNDMIPALIIYVLFIILFILNVKWIILLFTKTEWGHRAFPQMNKQLHDKKYSAEFFKDDVVFDPINNKYIVELPMFKNMYMDCEATGEFSKYLEKISIVEHPFSKYVKKRGKEMSKGRRLALKHYTHSSQVDPYYDKKPNIYLWKCIFEFKQKPTDESNLKIWFT